MRTIDIHAHMAPQCLWNALDGGGEWYGMHYQSGDRDTLVTRPGRAGRVSPKARFTPEQRLEDMDQSGTDVQVVSIQAQVMGRIEELAVTRIVVAHRLSTIREADRIYVFDEGRVAQQGTFAQLIETPGVFRDLARRQLA